MEAALIISALLLGLAGFGWWLNGKLSVRREDQALTLLQNQVQATVAQVEKLRDGVQQIAGQMNSSLAETRQAMDTRLDNATRVVGEVSKHLGQLDESARRIFDVGKDIAGLQEILRAPKLRGGLGELFLGDLLAQILPPDHFTLQHTFRSNEKVDAVIRLKAGLAPVDAKFPLENFQRLVRATGDDERAAARRVFVKDVQTHIDAIAKKYIRPDEGTFDFALMYIPAENVYYEVIVKDDEFGGESKLFNYALARRVIPVSPNSFYAYLQTILLGLKGLRVEDSARQIMGNLSRLQKEFATFGESFQLIGKQLRAAQNNFDDADKRFGKITNKLDQIAAETPAALPPPT
ncbi:MAG: DNA recombination protein RmuC [Verrucomicrobia bacterium]|nr:MAG: DNA recombination protein RmuC [Verrucomicrobiota bacterium]